MAGSLLRNSWLREVPLLRGRPGIAFFYDDTPGCGIPAVKAQAPRHMLNETSVVDLSPSLKYTQVGVNIRTCPHVGCLSECNTKIRDKTEDGFLVLVQHR